MLYATYCTRVFIDLFMRCILYEKIFNPVQLFIHAGGFTDLLEI